jgi:hypothetical protein
MARLVQAEQDAIIWPTPRGRHDSGPSANFGGDDHVRLAEFADLEAESLADVAGLTGLASAEVSGPILLKALKQLGADAPLA